MTGYSADEAEDESAKQNCSRFHFQHLPVLLPRDSKLIETENRWRVSLLITDYTHDPVMSVMAMLRQLRLRWFNRKLLQVRVQTQRTYPARNKPLDDVNNQKNRKCVSRKGKMDMKVPNHDPAGRSGAVP
jgi:hypothetical protein